MIRSVLFDLDGTLLDTAADLVAALNHVRAHEGFPAVAAGEYRHLVSKGAVGLIRNGMPVSDERVFEARRARFLAFYADNSLDRTRPFDGVPELLDQLRARAVPWGIVTNKPEYLTLPILEATGLLASAGCVICGDTLALRKPDPAPVRVACEILGADAAATLMVGDDPRDIEAGRAAGTHTALATYGYVEPDLDPGDFPDTHFIASPADVMGLLGQQPPHPGAPPSQ
jgi:phosphoglycolate phosphatase